MSPPQRAGIIVLAGVEIFATSMALLDLAKRPRELVRGPKFAWALACAIQPVGPFTYLALGRRKVDPVSQLSGGVVDGNGLAVAE